MKKLLIAALTAIAIPACGAPPAAGGNDDVEPTPFATPYVAWEAVCAPSHADDQGVGRAVSDTSASWEIDVRWDKVGEDPVLLELHSTIDLVGVIVLAGYDGTHLLTVDAELGDNVTLRVVCPDDGEVRALAAFQGE